MSVALYMDVHVYAAYVRLQVQWPRSALQGLAGGLGRFTRTC
ncbi:MAG TPA: hypothetical protein VGZ25_15380 [Gemmataceae bacterium]|nr:hypothetical protein [Gemmataceae bacterium]